MKKSITLLFTCLFSCVVLAQTLTETKVKINKNLKWTRTFGTINHGLAKTSTCGPDTVSYPYGKATQIQAVALNASTSGNLFAQYYPAPQQITVSGFEFYAWQSTGTSAVVNITCNIYSATLDSLPNGSPLRSVTIAVDSTFGNGSLTNLVKSAVFSSPVTFNGGGYVLTVETSSSTNVSIITNSYSYADGDKVFASSVRIGSTMYRSYDINVGGVPFDADFMLQPYVTYSLTANFTNTVCNNGGNNVTFTNTSSPVLFNGFYNYYALYGIAYVGIRWDYGDTTGLYSQQNGSHTYTYRATHQVTLKDTIYAWRRGCVDIVSKPSYHVPDPPAVSNNGPVCQGDTIDMQADSITGAVYSWIGPNSFSSSKRTHQFPNILNTQAGNYQVRIVQNTCTSAYAGTNVIVYPKPQKPVAINSGPKCVGDSVIFLVTNASGLKHAWTGPGFFSSDSATPLIGPVDTTHSGKYIVIVSDANCSSDADTTDFLVYPPPAPPQLGTFGNDTLCYGDTLKLKGGSVPGAVFNWRGPNGFMSNATHPTVLWVNNLNVGYYTSFVKIGSCSSQPDSIYIAVNDLPNTSAVTGSDTSTEALVKNYSVTGSSGSSFSWTVQGGTIQSGNGTSSISVLWGTPGTGKVSVVETNSSGCKDTVQEMNVSITEKPDPESLIEFAGGSRVLLYPNPATASVSLKFQLTEPKTIRMELSNVIGQSLYSNTLSPGALNFSETIDISSLKPGVYLIRISSGASSGTLRLLVE